MHFNELNIVIFTPTRYTKVILNIQSSIRANPMSYVYPYPWLPWHRAKPQDVLYVTLEAFLQDFSLC
jgi:hypothetical protein